MVKGTNDTLRLQLLEQGACYICERLDVPTHVDEIGGNICQECEARKQAVLQSHAQKAGCSARRRPKAGDTEKE